MLMIKKNGTLIPVGMTNLIGGPQPTLFAPTVTGGTNEISWANNTNNGGFDVTITADVDGTPVTSPLTITQEMDGSTLTIRASAQYFTDAVTTVNLSYISGSQTFISPSGYVADANNPYTYLIMFGYFQGTLSYNGQSYNTFTGESTRFVVPVDFSQNSSIDFTFTGSLAGGYSFYFGKSASSSYNVRYATTLQGMTYLTFATASVSALLQNGTVYRENTASNSNTIALANMGEGEPFHYIFNVSF